ncbi:glycoside hydrolase family 20 protein [Xylariomycetidae sp. FL0641]|nr:glycoside hydrolase family 20 protein [Xylariomycetidae sp. FL0641]
MYIRHLYELGAVTLFFAISSSRLVGIPTVPFTLSDNEEFSISTISTVIVDSAYADSRDENGETLIPPTLHDFATTFVDDLKSTVGVDVGLETGEEGAPDAIFLTLGNASAYTTASGSETSEGYTLSVSTSGITISGASPLGAWWGTRTVLQQAILSDGSIPYGEGKDAPGWTVRGMMLDGGRHFYPPDFISELCAYMSFYKQNTFHLHLSDNLYNNVENYSREQSLELYARFRLWSDADEVAGLNKHRNESYTKDDLEKIQSSCAARGVTVIPEIEAPGHSLVIVQWKPELGLSSDLSQLNISHPETIPTAKAIWSTFIDWFHSKTVHIGADEYKGDVSEYNRFVTEMADFIHETAGKATRIWGTFPPQPEYDNISTNVSVQHWEYFEDNPLYDYILKDYAVLNSDDTFYVVNKWSGSYPQIVNVSKTFNGNPSSHGAWEPFVFDTKNASNNPERDNSLVLGEVAALWNDYGANASVYSEAYYAWRDGIPALADKQWGGDLSATEFPSAFEKLTPSIPGQNLDRAIPSNSSTIFQYNATALKKKCSGKTKRAEKIVLDQSANGYDAVTTCGSSPDGTLELDPSCSLDTPLSSKGRNYTLTLRLRVDEIVSDKATLVSGRDSTLLLTPNITLFASGNYYRLNSTMPVGEMVDLRVVGRGNQTFASVQTAAGVGGDEEEFLAVLGINGEYLVWAPVAVEAPIARVGGQGAGWKGSLAGMALNADA